MTETIHGYCTTDTNDKHMFKRDKFTLSQQSASVMLAFQIDIFVWIFWSPIDTQKQCIMYKSESMNAPRLCEHKSLEISKCVCESSLVHSIAPFNKIFTHMNNNICQRPIRFRISYLIFDLMKAMIY